jgi:uncharacterized protein (DUF1499 family)
MQQNVWSRTLDTNVDIHNKLAKEVHELFTQLMNAKIDNMNEDEKRIVLVKAIGNSGIRESLNVLHEIVTDNTKYNLPLRVQSIYAMRFLTVRFSHEIKRVLLPIFFNTVANTELRMASFIIIMRTRPTRQELDSMLYTVQREPVKQIRSFVMSHWRTIVESQDECSREIRENVTRVMEMVDYERFGAQYSRQFALPISSRHNIFMRSGIFWTPEEFLPRAANLKFFTETSGKKIEFLEIGARMDGLQKLLTKLFGPNGRFFDVRKLEELIKEYEPNAVLTDNNFSFYLNIFGDQLGYWALDENMKEVMQSGYIALKRDWIDIIRGIKPLAMDLKRTYYNDAVMRIPTAFGIPFTANFSLLVHAHLLGEAKFTEGLFNAKRTLLDVKLTPRVISEHTLVGGVDMSIIQAYTMIKLHASLPMNRNINFKLGYENGEDNLRAVRLFFERPQEDLTMFHVDNKITNIVKMIKQDYNIWTVEEKQVLVKYETEKSQEELYAPKAFEYSCEGTGMAVKVDYAQKIERLLKSRLHRIFTGNFFYKMRIVNNEKENRDYIEKRLVYKMQTKSFPSSIFMAQTLRSSEESVAQMLVLKEESVQQRRNPRFSENKEDQIKDFKYLQQLSQKLSDLTKSKLLRELLIMTPRKVEQTDNSDNLKYQWAAMFRFLNADQLERYVITGLATLPKEIQFDPINPLKVFTNEKLESLLREIVETNVYDFTSENLDKKLMSFRAIFDTNKETLRLKDLISKNIDEYTAMHRYIRQCSLDINSNLKNSVACQQTWRYLNIFNRINGTVFVEKKAPQTLKRFITVIMNLSNRMAGPVSFINVMPTTEQENEFLQSKDLSFNRVLEVSPFDMRVISMRMAINNIEMTLRGAQLPQIWINHMHPNEKLSEGFARVLSDMRYPAICSTRHNDAGLVQIETFDGFLYNSAHTKNDQGNVARIVFSQDAANTYQVSMQIIENTRVLQMLTQHPMMKRVQIVREESQPFKVLVNGEVLQFNENGEIDLKENENVILRIKSWKRAGDNMELVLIDAVKIGVSFTTDLQYMTDIQVSPFYHSTVRGLCGDFDGENREEIKSLDCKKFYYRFNRIDRACDYVLYANKMDKTLDDLLAHKTLTGFLNVDRCQRDDRSMLRLLLQPVSLEQVQGNCKIEL